MQVRADFPTIGSLICSALNGRTTSLSADWPSVNVSVSLTFFGEQYQRSWTLKVQASLYFRRPGNGPCLDWDIPIPNPVPDDDDIPF